MTIIIEYISNKDQDYTNTDRIRNHKWKQISNNKIMIILQLRVIFLILYVKIFLQSLFNSQHIKYIILLNISFSQINIIIMQLFSRREFLDYENKIYLSVKKNLESTVEFNSQILEYEVSDDSDQQVFVKSKATVNIKYEDEIVEVPTELLDLPTLRDLFNNQTYNQIFDQVEKKHLAKFLPQPNIEPLLSGANFHFGNPLDIFQRKFKKGEFTKLKQKQDQLQHELQKQQMLIYYQNLFQEITKRNELNKMSFKRKLPEMNEQQSSVSSLEELKPENTFSDASDETETQEDVSENNEDFEGQKYITQVFFKYEDRRKTQEQLIAMTDDRNEYKVKVPRPVSTVKQSKCVDWIQIYRKQEQQRYNNPTKPWTYTCQDGRKVTVAPVAKKVTLCTGKPRQHPLLKQDRPSCVTILTLVRDAAARLPNGVGTRADICQLLKQSQYVNEDIPDNSISNIVSGALDRLHYMPDACVKYDNQKKLWIYLHLDRSDQHPGWGDDLGDEIYKEKKPTKKKKYEKMDMQ